MGWSDLESVRKSLLLRVDSVLCSKTAVYLKTAWYYDYKTTTRCFEKKTTNKSNKHDFNLLTHLHLHGLVYDFVHFYMYLI